ncbi:MAG: AAA family ATPase [Mastigocoleus sp. MO_167.B18]|nr:AAA family ATPase [Mastigocoleus sp. MO_167.B18]
MPSNIKQAPELLTNIYNAFDPFRPLPAGDPTYIDCREVRGDGDILLDLGNRIKLSKENTCQLYSGHRGAGKSTELLRLKQFLEEKNFYVVYFAADEEDIDSEDAQYTDILLACTRHILEGLKNNGNANLVLQWLEGRWEDIKDLAQTEVSFQGMSMEAQISQFAKLTANLRAEPSLREKIRKKVDPYTVTLIQVLNQFLREVKKKLPDGRSELAVIVDNLDRIAPIITDSGKINHEEIFLDRSEQLKALDCHLIYTVPISLVYSKRSTDVRENYSDTEVLPMIMVRTPNGTICEPGLNKIKEIISKRISQCTTYLSLDTEIFDSPETFQQLCLMSGGHVRNLLLLTQDAIALTEELPISQRAVRRAITKARNTYRQTVEHNQWDLLAKVFHSKRVINDNEHRSLLFNRCFLEYRYLDQEYEIQRWCDVHPLIKGITEFKEAVAKIQP